MNRLVNYDPSSPLYRQAVTRRDTEILPGHFENDEEIIEFMDTAYQAADKVSPTGTRTPDDIQNLKELKNQLQQDLRDREKEKEENNAHSLGWQNWADQQRKKTELSVKREKMNRLRDALKNPEVKKLVMMVMKDELMPEQAFHSIKANTRGGYNHRRHKSNKKGKYKSRKFRKSYKRKTIRKSSVSIRKH